MCVTQVWPSEPRNLMEEGPRNFRKGFSTEQWRRLMPRSGGDRTAGLAAGCQRDRLNDKGQDPGGQS